MELVGGRAIHPVNGRVGSFYRAPAKPEMAVLAEKLRVALDQALDTVRWAAGFEFPDFHHDHEMLALSQNQASIEDDLRRFVAGRLDLDDEHLTRQCEQAIRNYDPCIACATHFLDLTVDRA
jgi:coenzyme F420-reducing hydrogenase alpha subunit